MDYSKYTPLPDGRNSTVESACMTTLLNSIYALRHGEYIEASPVDGLYFRIEVAKAAVPQLADMSEWFSFTVNGVFVGNRGACVRVIMDMFMIWHREHVVDNFPPLKPWPVLYALVESKIDYLWPPISEDGDRLSFYHEYMHRLTIVKSLFDLGQRHNDNVMLTAAHNRLALLYSDLTHLDYVRTKYPQHSFETITTILGRTDL